MTAPETPETLGYRHVRTIAGLVGMGLAIGAAVAIQVVRHAEQAALQAALLAKGLPVPEIVLPTSLLQFAYSLAIPVGMPLVLFGCSLMLFSPAVAREIGQAVRSVLPGAKPA